VIVARSRSMAPVRNADRVSEAAHNEPEGSTMSTTTARPTVPNATPKAEAGDRVNTYDGPGTVQRVYEDHAFYGAPPMVQGEYTGGSWDGMAYVVKCDNGRVTTFDRTRIRRFTR
jgi:hypothetical protein